MRISVASGSANALQRLRRVAKHVAVWIVKHVGQGVDGLLGHWPQLGNRQRCVPPHGLILVGECLDQRGHRIGRALRHSGPRASTAWLRTDGCRSLRRASMMVCKASRAPSPISPSVSTARALSHSSDDLRDIDERGDRRPSHGRQSVAGVRRLLHLSGHAAQSILVVVPVVGAPGTHGVDQRPDSRLAHRAQGVRRVEGGRLGIATQRWQ